MAYTSATDALQNLNRGVCDCLVCLCMHKNCRFDRAWCYLGAVVESWLSRNQSQLTYTGLEELHRVVQVASSTLACITLLNRSFFQNGALAVLFRNNHFSLIHKQSDVIYMVC